MTVGIENKGGEITFFIFRSHPGFSIIFSPMFKGCLMKLFDIFFASCCESYMHRVRKKILGNGRTYFNHFRLKAERLGERLEIALS